mgnify:CR=1 FL=1
MLSLRNAYPVTLGANVGTTVTALLAALAASRPEALTIAIVHTLFNVSAICILYPVPAIRDLPIRAAESMARLATVRPRWAVTYVAVTFLIIPAIGVVLLR